MATKSPFVRGVVPTVSDLLESPSVRALADRWNRSTVVAGVKSFLDDLRSDLARRGEEAGWPPLRELAERAARHILATQQASYRPAINATGRFWGSPWVGRPQGEAALERAFVAGREFVVAPTHAGSISFGDVESHLCRLTGAAAAVAVHSYAGGLWLALAAIATGRQVIVARGELGELEPGCSTSSLIASTGASLREVGSTNRTTAADYEAGIRPESAAILTVCPEAFCVLGETQAAALDELVALSRDRELVLIESLGAAPLVDLPKEIAWPSRSLQSSLAAGVNLAIIRGDGLFGGPACGILAGDRDIIRQVCQHPMFAAWRLDWPRNAALSATLAWYENQSADDRLPLIELLLTPIDNLRNRAERLAPQLAQAAGVVAAEPLAMVSRCDGLPTPGHELASFGVALTASNGDVAALDRRLRSAAEPVCGRIEEYRLILDLRTVLARHDQAIVRALLSPADVARRESPSESPAVSG
jgi:L-seryl-tRNA(Ser) seleniumtransferase